MKTEVEKSGHRVMLPPRRLYILIGMAGLFIALIIAYGFYTGERMSRVDGPSANAVAIARLEAINANHWLEEILSGRNYENADVIWQHLDQAVWYLQTVLESEKQPQSDGFPFGSTDSQAVIEVLRNKLSEVKEHAWRRIAANQLYGAGNDADRSYQDKYQELTEQIDGLQAGLRKIKAQKLSHFRTTQITLISICIVLSFFVGTAFQRFERRRARDFEILQQSNEKLNREMAERRLAEEAMRESEERFRQLAENIQDLFWLESAREPNRIIYISPAYEKLWGRKAAAPAEIESLLLQGVHPEDKPRVGRSFDELHQSGTDVNLEFRIVWPDGSTRWIWARTYGIRNPQGQIYRIAGLAQDITARKLDQQRREELFAEIRSFAHIVTHDLRAPLGNLKGFAREIDEAAAVVRPVVQEVLEALPEQRRREIVAAFEEDLPAALDFMRTSLSRMENLINAILKLSWSGNRELCLEPLDMNALVQETLKTLAYRIKEHRVSVAVEGLPETRADRVAMEQIMSNLLSNAVNYLDSGRSGRIEISGIRRVHETVFQVRDNGRGIEPSEQEMVFDMFQRLGEKHIAGEGMGLAYVRTLVRRHGGRIRCESQPGVGSLFTFTIPSHAPHNLKSLRLPADRLNGFPII